MMTYGAYLDEDVSIGQSAVFIAVLDTVVALLAGVAIFPLVFSYGLEPSSGPGLTIRREGGSSARAGAAASATSSVASERSERRVIEVPRPESTSGGPGRPRARRR